MDFDTTYLLVSLLFGCVGTGYIIYSRKAGKLLPAVAGLGLVILPYLISSTIVMAIVCLIMAAAPFVFREL